MLDFAGLRNCSIERRAGAVVGIMAQGFTSSANGRSWLQADVTAHSTLRPVSALNYRQPCHRSAHLREAEEDDATADVPFERGLHVLKDQFQRKAAVTPGDARPGHRDRNHNVPDGG